ncbi:MAG: HNH endonuclease [Synergistaceae bacterium]|jgi:hypothetical protein|nr:HNH endonuclease [Synergistaceae bacterium]
MHILIAKRLNLKQVDHIDGNGLNNQRSNLRKTTTKQNSYNKKLAKNNTTGYKGVRWRSDRGNYTVMISVNKKQIYVGSSHNILEAATMYNKAAKKYHGKFASINVL